ncbi:MAG: DNA-methyltransferase [Candidatus Helarchaeales archaeon]
MGSGFPRLMRMSGTRKARSSLALIRDFLLMNGIRIDPERYLGAYLVQKDDVVELPEDIIDRIILDSYKFSNVVVKEISDELFKRFDIYLGRVQKNQLKKFMDYRHEGDLETFFQLIHASNEFSSDEIRKIITAHAKMHEQDAIRAVDLFLRELRKEIEGGSVPRIRRLLLFLYSRLINLNENRKISLQELFEVNADFIREELSESDFIRLSELCNNLAERDRREVVAEFNAHYLQIFEDREDYRHKFSVIYLEVDQGLFNAFNSRDEFYDRLFQFVERSFRELRNHRTLIIRVRNVLDGDLNIKWEIYSRLTIFAEMFLRRRETGQYYFPEVMFRDTLEHLFGVELSEDDVARVRSFYRGEISLEELERNAGFDVRKHEELLRYFENIRTGFRFVDCFMLKTETNFKNSQEIHFIRNQNELLLIFMKHVANEKKIPCPVCGSLRISGNSYSEIGIKSWECKNPFCAERSKNNRGKRYSERTIFMQNSTFDFSSENQIPKRLVKKWRKDVVEEWSPADLHEMMVKFYSHVGDAVAAINVRDSESLRSICEQQKRKFKSFQFEEYVKFEEMERDSNAFLDSVFLIGNMECLLVNLETDGNLLELLSDEAINIVHGNSLDVLRKLPRNSIDGMVTSPPYYNARKYSTWKNLLCYLFDIYRIIHLSERVLQEGGVFLFNVGDIYGNDNLIVKSNMGLRRIPLGAYMIFLFQRAGFELLDNIIWYKGEPQSNRHKNDGNFVPYYQRPTNCYEHVFIFKKKGKIRLNADLNENILTSNMQKFSPVIKIFGGKNRHGHSAPFPTRIPLMLITCFTSKHDLVVDPFSGSGTSVMAALKSNRRCLGIEINEEFVKLILKKAREEGLDISLVKLRHSCK